MTKGELFDEIRRERAALERTVSEFSTDELARAPKSGGWAVKDHLAHMSAWERMLVAHVTDGSDHAIVGMTAAQYAAANLEELNERIYEQHRDEAADEMMATFRRSHDAIIAAITSIDEAEFAKPYWSDDPSRSVMDKIAGDTYLHYAEHRGWIVELAERVRGEEAAAT